MDSLMDYGQYHLIRERLERPREFDWSVHGIGMLRTYLDEHRRFRMNLWHPCLINPGISTMHTHPWPFTSKIVAGRLQNTRFDRCTKKSVGARLFNEGRITCGLGASTNTVFPGLNGPPEVTILHARPPEIYTAGMTYRQEPHEIHDTAAQAGTITIIERGEERPGCEASVFWPLNTEWGDASRTFDWLDADRVIAAALHRLTAEKQV